MQLVLQSQSPQVQVSTESIAAYAVQTYEKQILTNDQKQLTILKPSRQTTIPSKHPSRLQRVQKPTQPLRAEYTHVVSYSH